MKNVLGQHRLRHIALAAVALSLTAGLTPTVTADGDDMRRRLPLDIDVAVNGVTSRPILAGEPTADGFPPRGSTFIIDGYVYPAGTFASRGLDKGILPDGMRRVPRARHWNVDVSRLVLGRSRSHDDRRLCRDHPVLRFQGRTRAGGFLHGGV